MSRYTAEELKVVRLSSKDAQSWALMPQISARVLAFGIKIGEKDPEALVKRLEAAFTLGLETWACWMLVRQSDYQVIGHLLAKDDEWGGHPIGLVLQLELEPGAMTPAMMEEVNGELRAWARSMGYPRILMSTRRGRLRAWKRLFGFIPYRLIMSCELTPDAHD